MFMNQNEYVKFIEAVDVVCDYCFNRSETVCESCPVRVTVTVINNTKKMAD